MAMPEAQIYLREIMSIAGPLDFDRDVVLLAMALLILMGGLVALAG
jgi:hypothetical protein